MNQITLSSLIFQLVAGFLPLVVFLIKKNKFNIEFTFFLTISFLATCAILTTSILNLPNVIIFNSYQVISTLCINIFYYRVLNKKSFSRIVLVISVLEFISYGSEFLIFGDIDKSILVEVIGTICCSILLFVFMLNLRNSTNYQTISLVNFSIFIYKISSFLLFCFLVTLMVKDIWYVHNFIEGSSKLLIAYALWKLPKTAHS
ncbi:MAG: hypothetical protein RIS20_1213 [Bacteroidota bacterium]